jgi:hypothetical protein
MNIASQTKTILRKSHYAVESQTDRPGYGQQYDYQLYPASLKELLAKTGPDLLRIIPIGDFDVDADYWVIPFTVLKELLVPEHLTKGLTKDGTPRTRRWRFHIERHEKHLFVLYPGNRLRLGEIDVRQYYGADLPLPLEWQKLLQKHYV